MANTRTFQRAFSGGEMSPEMVVRIGDNAVQNGAARMRNMIATPRGTAMRRPGFGLVAETADSTKASVLVPFRYSNTDALMIELGEGYFRFHREGAPIKYANLRLISSVDTGTERITFAEPHEFADDTQVRLIRPGASTSPTGLSTSTTYYAQFITSYVVELALTPGGAAVDITGVGSGDLYLTDASSVPADYISSKNVVTSLGTVMEVTTHGFTTGDPIEFTHTGTLTTPLVVGVTYYAIVTDGSHFKVAETYADALAGTPISLGASGTNIRVHYAYVSGDLTNYPNSGIYYCTTDRPCDNAPGVAGWHLLPFSGVFEIPNDYVEADLADIDYAQSNDVIKFTHLDYDLVQLSRYDTLDWARLVKETYSPTLGQPEFTSQVSDPGEYHQVYSYTNSGNGPPCAFLRGPLQSNEYAQLPLATGDSVWLAASADGTGAVQGNAAGLYTVSVRGGGQDGFALHAIAGGATLSFNVATNTFLGYVWVTSSSSTRNEYYRVSALSATGEESLASSGIEVVNDLLVPGSNNQVVWDAIPDAVRYRVYKLQTGLYGYIGDTDDTSFLDENIGPDLGITPLVADDSLDGDTNPAVLAYFETRLCLASGQTIWMTRSNTEFDLTYHIPVIDTDRIKFTLQARDVATIRHIVPMDNLVILTDSTEFVVTPVNSDAITPTSFRARPVSYIGANTVRPVVVNNSLVFCAARGGHVRVFGRSNDGYATGDLSLRAAHLFDNLSVVSMAHQKAPFSIVWAVSSDGTLLGLTYVPEENIAGWHWHDTDGTFESVAVIPEGDEDRVYAIVKRTIDGSTVRFVERLGPLSFDELEDACYVDCSVTSDERNTSAVTITATTGTTWTAGSTITLTASSSLFVTGTPATGAGISMTDAAGTEVRFTISSVTSPTVAVATPDVTVPTGLRSAATTNWKGFRQAIAVADHLEGETVDILADGEIQFPLEVASGAFTLTAAASVTHFGLPYTSELKTLPVAFQIDGAFGQGRTKGVNRLWLRVLDSCRFEAGPSEDDMSTTNDIDEDTLVAEQEIDVNIPSDWTDGGQVWIRQTDPVPLSVASLVAEVSIGS